MVKVLSVSRSNNVSIMLTQFAEFAAGGPMALRAALLSGADLGVERLSLLLQVCQPRRCCDVYFTVIAVVRCMFCREYAGSRYTEAMTSCCH